MITLSINFSDGSNHTIRDAKYVPNIGESVHNEKDVYYRYFVDKKDIYYNDNISVNIIISAVKPSI